MKILRKKILHMTPDFPYICCYVEMDKYPGDILLILHDEIVNLCTEVPSNIISRKDRNAFEGDGCFIELQCTAFAETF